MEKRKILFLCLYMFFSVAIGFFSAGFLHAFLSGSVVKLSIRYLLVLLAVDRRFLCLFLFMTTFIILCLIVISLDNKPYKSDLTEVAQGISIPVSAGQLQHGSARFLNEEEIDRTFASVILTKSIMSCDMEANKEEIALE